MKTLFHILITLAFGLFVSAGVAVLAFEHNLAGDLMIGCFIVGLVAMLLPYPDDLPRA